MRARQILVIVLAFVIAAGAALLARNYFRPAPAPVVQQTAQQAPVQQREILVAATPIQIGVFLKEDSLVWQPWPSDQPAAFYFERGGDTEKSALVGGIARRAFNAGEPITRGDIIRPTDSGFLAAVMKPGQRAVSIDVNPASIVAGLVAPGDLVDIIMTNRFSVVDPQEGQRGEISTGETVLRAVRILAMDQRLSSRMPVTEQNGQQQAQGGAGVPRTIMLEVSPKDAERLSVATRLGDLTISLRAFAKDTGIAAEPTADASDGAAGATTASTTGGTMMDSAQVPTRGAAVSGAATPSGVPGLPAPTGGIGGAPAPGTPAPGAQAGLIQEQPVPLPFTPDTEVSAALSYISGPFGTSPQRQREEAKAEEEKPKIVIMRGASRQQLEVSEAAAESNRALATIGAQLLQQSTQSGTQGAGAAAATPATAAGSTP